MEHLLDYIPFNKILRKKDIILRNVKKVLKQFTEGRGRNSSPPPQL